MYTIPLLAQLTITQTSYSCLGNICSCTFARIVRICYVNVSL